MMYLESFNKIENMTESLYNRFSNAPNAHKCDWFVTEMIDGAHFALYADYATKEVRGATRKRFLHSKTDIYYDWEDVIKINRNWILELSKEVKGSVIVYGKITGGHYRNNKLGVNVPTVCEYCPNNDFIIHDIKIKAGFLAAHEMEHVAKTHVLTLAPTLFSGGFKACWGFPNNNLSVIPFINELDINYNNEMKGIVIRPLYDMDYYSRRIIAKNLNRKYVGKPNTAKPALILTTELKQLACIMDCRAAEMGLLHTTISVNGGLSYKEIDKIAGKYTKLLLDKVVNVSYNNLSDLEKNLVNKELNELGRTKLLAIYRTGDEAA